MKQIQIGYVIYDLNDKCFRDSDGSDCDNLLEAEMFLYETHAKTVKESFDEPDGYEVWRVLATTETI